MINQLQCLARQVAVCSMASLDHACCGTMVAFSNILKLMHKKHSYRLKAMQEVCTQACSIGAKQAVHAVA